MNFYYKQLNNDYQFYSRFDIINSADSIQPYDLNFCISSLDNYRFTRKPANFSIAIRDFLLRLRNKYKKINLWYSGGVDSHFLLYNFIKYDIPLDEITICKKQPFGDHVYSKLTAEETYTAMPYISTIAAGYIKQHQTKLSTPIIGIQEYEKFFKDSSWIKHTLIGDIRSPTYISNAIKLVPDIDTDPSTCNLNGSETPFVIYDNGWKFYFVDRQIIPENNDLIYKPTTSDPEFLESYVNAIIDQLERIPGYKEKFSKTGSRDVRSKFFTQIIPEIQEINSSIWAQYPKVSFDSDGSDIKDLVNHLSVKTLLDYRSALELQPNWFLDYCNNTDWKAIERNYHFGGILTKEFDIR
jgi:hypothetical protein